MKLFSAWWRVKCLINQTARLKSAESPLIVELVSLAATRPFVLAPALNSLCLRHQYSA